MSNVCAAIGLGQLEFLPKKLNQKRNIYEYYKESLSCIDSIKFLEEDNLSFSNYWITTIFLDKKSTIDREELRLHMEKDNIESRPLWKPMHLQPIFRYCKSYVNNVSEDLYNRGLCLPSGTNMSKKELERVVNSIKELYEA